ncbi:hypothetical protein [Vibrio rumoiensis]|uniref:hypothetical protein n=1 Tax=Vibrio rumoiensis TaxID=76258 RepID=UPI00031CC033|nr:hypothetical protein [Vibrio rumoiensis]
MWLSLIFSLLEERPETKTTIFSTSPYGMPIVLHHIDASDNVKPTINQSFHFDA